MCVCCNCTGTCLGPVALMVIRGRFQCDMAHLGSSQFLLRRLRILLTERPLSVGMGTAWLSCQIAYLHADRGRALYCGLLE